MLERKKPKNFYIIKYCKKEEYLHSNILNFTYGLYQRHAQPSKTEAILRDIINHAKECYLEGEEE